MRKKLGANVRNTNIIIPDLKKIPEDVILNSAIQSCIKVLQNQQANKKYIDAAENVVNNADLDIKSEGFLLLLLRIINNRKNPRNVLVGGAKNSDLAILCEDINIADLTEAISNVKRFTENNNLAFANVEIPLVGGGAAAAPKWVDGALSLMSKLLDKGVKLAEPVAEKLATDAIRKAGPTNVIYYSLGAIANAVKVMAIDNSQALISAASSRPLVMFGLGAVVMGVSMFALTFKKGSNNARNGVNKTLKNVNNTIKAVNNTTIGVNNTRKGVNNNRKGVNNTRKGVNNTHRPPAPPASAPAAPLLANKTSKGVNNNRKGVLNMILEEDPSPMTF